MTNIKKYFGLFLLCFLSNWAGAQPAGTLMLKLEVGDNNYNLLDALVLPRAFPATASMEHSKEGSLNWEISSIDGAVLAKGIIPDPQVIRAHLGEKDKLSLKTSRLEKTTVVIRVPYLENMHKLSIERTPIIYLPAVTSNGLTKTKKPDLQKHDFSIEPRVIQ